MSHDSKIAEDKVGLLEGLVTTRAIRRYRVNLSQNMS